jgi:NAD(P)-dependent dehydrogenase (short-subunit alcohol dehydrogenase family)
MAWTVSDMPPQDGRSAVVTGAGGLGFETALALARAGAEVILASRNPEKGAAAVDEVRAAAPEAQVRFERLDLASLASVRDFAARLLGERTRLDLLVNNAGVMALPKRQVTEDGFERQFGTNHLGHFALTALLAPLLRAAAAPRVVTVSSLAHLQGAIHFDDLQWEGRYRPSAAYAQSKLANLLFALELQRRADAAGWNLKSLAAHPGVSRTELIANGPGGGFGGYKLFKMIVGPLLSQSAAAGALPTLYAATAPDVRGGDYFGPDGPIEMKGAPARARISSRAKDEAVARRLWEESERLTGVTFRPGN